MHTCKLPKCIFVLCSYTVQVVHCFTVMQLVLAQGSRCALHLALGNQCSLCILYLSTGEPLRAVNCCFTGAVISHSEDLYHHFLSHLDPVHQQQREVIITQDSHEWHQLVFIWFKNLLWLIVLLDGQKKKSYPAIIIIYQLSFCFYASAVS